MSPSNNPADANISVARAAVILGVHPNTVRAWSDQGRLPFYRINARGDRRYRPSDLRAFLAAGEQPPAPRRPAERQGPARPFAPLGRDLVEERTRPGEMRVAPPTFGRTRGLAASGSSGSSGSSGPSSISGSSGISGVPVAPGAPAYARFVRIDAEDGGTREDPVQAGDDMRRPSAEISILAELVAMVRPGGDPLAVMTAAVELLHDRAGHDLVAILELRGTELLPRVARGVGASRLAGIARDRGLPGRALAGMDARVETSPPPHVDEWLAPGRLLHGRIAAPIAAPAPAPAPAATRADARAVAAAAPGRAAGAGATPGGAPVPWGILVVADEGSAAARAWAPVVEAVARVLGLALAIAGSPRVLTPDD